MNRRKTILILLLTGLTILMFAIYNYLISIYEVVYLVSPEQLYADNKSEVTITAAPINALGWRALFRRVETDYTITEGEVLVDILEYDKANGILKIKANEKTGIVKIVAKCNYAFLPSPINIVIYPNVVEVKHEVKEII